MLAPVGLQAKAEFRWRHETTLRHDVRSEIENYSQQQDNRIYQHSGVVFQQELHAGHRVPGKRNGICACVVSGSCSLHRMLRGPKRRARIANSAGATLTSTGEVFRACAPMLLGRRVGLVAHTEYLRYVEQRYRK